MNELTWKAPRAVARLREWLGRVFSTRPVVTGNWAERHRRMKALLGTQEEAR